MGFTSRCIFTIGFILVLSASKFAAQSQEKTTTITISEPGTTELSDLFRQADIVALVKTVSGDTESYDDAVYKSEVVKMFKGTKRGENIYFGPFIGERLGWEYIVFLRKEPKLLSPKTALKNGYGVIPYAKVFKEGYTAMETSYECVFSDRGGDSCDYAVRVCTDYIRLPKTMQAFPTKEPMPFGCKWVRKPTFLSALAAMEKTNR